MRRWVPKITSGPASPVPDILWWKCNDGSGTTVTAAVGPNGTTNAAWVTGASGSGFALDFNGSSQKANTVSSVTYGVNIVTLCFWAFFDDISTFQDIFESSVSVGGANTIQAYLNGGDFLVAMSDTGGNLRLESFTAPATGTWRQFSIVYDGSTSAGDLKIYLNGVLQSTTIVLNLRSGTSNVATNTAYIAARAATSAFYNGRLDDLRIYARELTPTEILQVVADPQ